MSSNNVPAPENPQAADLELLQAYKALGTPEEITKAKGIAQEAARTATLARAAEASKLHGPGSYDLEVLAHLAKGLEFVPSKVRGRDGQLHDTVKVRIAEGGREKLLTLEEMETGPWRKWLPSLRPGSHVPATQSASGRAVGTAPFRGTESIQADASVEKTAANDHHARKAAGGI